MVPEVHRCAGPGRLRYLLALPRARAAGPLPLVVSVHGYTRQPVAHWRAFAERLNARGVALLLPWFTERGFRQYQQLVRPRRPDRPQRADLALIEAVDDAATRHGLRFDRWALFGHSGGAQFAHRFAMAHPERVAALGLSAAGWYTMPSAAWHYPYGLAGAEDWLQRRVDLAAFLRLPVRVWVGRRDRDDHLHLRQEPQVREVQGVHRLQRARRWVRALRTAAAMHGIAADVALHELPGAGHDFEHCVRAGLAEQVLAFFDACARQGGADAVGAAGPAGAAGAAGGAGAAGNGGDAGAWLYRAGSALSTEEPA